MKDLLASHSEIDSTADAEVLMDHAIIEYEYDNRLGFSYRTFVHKRIKIYKSSALDRGNFSIPLYNKSSANGELISNFKGITYNIENGKMVKDDLSRKSIVQEKVTDTYSQKKISMPNVKEGSVIEYQYQLTTPLNVLNSPRTWYFQTDIPVKSSQLDITIPSHFYYQVMMGGYLSLDLNERENVTVDMSNATLNTNGTRYLFGVKNAPAFKDEKFITTESDYISKIDFELSSISIPNQLEQNFNESWESLDQTLLASESWGKNFSSSKDIRELAAKYQGLNSDEEKTKAILNYVTRNIKWNDEIRLWGKENAKRVLEDKTGNSSQLNILLCSILREAGIEANPVIMSTRKNGRINTTYPLLDRFNNTIVAVKLGEEWKFMDATYPLSKPGELPERCLVGIGRMITKDKGEFVEIKANDRYSEMTVVKAKIYPEDGKIVGDYSESASGILGHALKVMYKESGEEELVKSIKASQEDWNIENVELENFDKDASSVTIKAHFEQEEGGVMPDMIYMPAILISKVEENPFKKKERMFPVNFGHKTSKTFQAEYEIPEGFQVEALPQSISLAMPAGEGRFMFTVQEKENKIVVMSRIVLKKSEYTANEYPYLKEFYAKIVEKHAEQIVLSQI